MLEVDLLGPVEASVDGVEIPLSPLERNTLTLLTLNRGNVLSTDRLIDQLWDDRLPASPRSRVQGLVSGLRRKIGAVLITRHPGYVLDIDELAVDAGKCEQLAIRAGTADTAQESARLLRTALALWRGEPLDGVGAPGADADRARLAEWHVGLLEARFDAELRCGRHAELVGELTAAVAAHPLRERLAGQHMTALHRDNRRADALRAYQALRRRLADELGSDPCEELQALHATILRGPDAPGPARRRFARRKKAPAQLPPGVGHFTGRDAELRALTGALDEPAEEPRVLAVTAAGGLGKTALVVRWAHSVAHRFPDGQVFLDLRGNDPHHALGAEAALAAVLAALGVARKQLPSTLPERVARYRTLLNGRRVLVVADDAGSVGQVLPLVPPTPESQLVSTSRRRLHGLCTQHAVRELTVEPLPYDASRDLLGALLGPERVRDPALDEIIRWCGGWPLALRLAGAKLAARPSQPAASFAEELRGADGAVDAAGGLAVDGDPRSVPGALADAFGGLSPDAARLFDQLSRTGTAVSLQMAAAAADTSPRQARELLDELNAAHLIVETRSGRFRFHDLVRRFAGQWSGGNDVPAQRDGHPVADSQRI